MRPKGCPLRERERDLGAPAISTKHALSYRELGSVQSLAIDKPQTRPSHGNDAAQENDICLGNTFAKNRKFKEQESCQGQRQRLLAVTWQAFPRDKSLRQTNVGQRLQDRNLREFGNGADRAEDRLRIHVRRETRYRVLVSRGSTLNSANCPWPGEVKDIPVLEDQSDQDDQPFRCLLRVPQEYSWTTMTTCWSPYPAPGRPERRLLSVKS